MKHLKIKLETNENQYNLRLQIYLQRIVHDILPQIDFLTFTILRYSIIIDFQFQSTTICVMLNDIKNVV